MQIYAGCKYSHLSHHISHVDKSAPFPHVGHGLSIPRVDYSVSVCRAEGFSGLYVGDGLLPGRKVLPSQPLHLNSHSGLPALHKFVLEMSSVSSYPWVQSTASLMLFKNHGGSGSNDAIWDYHTLIFCLFIYLRPHPLVLRIVGLRNYNTIAAGRVLAFHATKPARSHMTPQALLWEIPNYWFKSNPWTSLGIAPKQDLKKR